MRSIYFEWGRRAGRRVAQATLRRQAASPPPQGWSAHRLRLPASWYNEVAALEGVEFPVSGDATASDSQLLGFVRANVEAPLMPWQEQILFGMGHARDTPRPTHP